MAGRRRGPIEGQGELEFLWGQPEEVRDEQVRDAGAGLVAGAPAGEFSTMDDPVSFFSTLGEQIAARATELAPTLEGPDAAGRGT